MTDETSEDHRFTEPAIEAFIRIALIANLAAWCFKIVRPFLVPLISDARLESGSCAAAPIRGTRQGSFSDAIVADSRRG